MVYPMLRQPPVEPPDGAPKEWAWMSSHARSTWIKRQLMATRIDDDDTGERPDECDGQGRTVWDLQQMRDAVNVCRRYKQGKSIEPPTEDQLDAARGYYRWRRRNAKAKAGVEERNPLPRELTLAAVLELSAGGFTPAEICSRLNISPHNVQRQLDRCERRDLSEPYRVLRAAVAATDRLEAWRNR